MDFVALLQQGNGWFFIPSAILLGALHGLEPGHSKTMMAAFIVAVKGTVKQAVMLGLAATLSHTAIVWLIAVGGMYISQKFTAEAAEPWMQLISGVIIVSTGLWMFWRTWSDERAWHKAQNHAYEWTTQVVDTGHGHVSLSITEEGFHHRFQLQTLNGKPLTAEGVKVSVPSNNSQSSDIYHFIERDGYLESASCIEASDDFCVTLIIGHHDHTHDFDVHFSSGSHPGSDNKEYQDAHERAHALDIQKRFENRDVTNGQILLFGLTGGLIPCPAAVTVLLICLQLKAMTLGATLVVSFSIGLALTLVAVGVVAAVGVQKATSKWSGLNDVARRAPYLSGVLISAVGLYMGMHGYTSLMN
ncbi:MULTISPECIES: nickel/cobalt efflux protein RcnA [Vibrio]|uniref:nickel/cobalt efflux protein RcnA n=1 Tax=Vibrio TaxID=662 RepID=UPI0018C24C44|nr:MULTISPECIES: nickel/cobalt efflux protein RcnA [Vibrio]EGR1157119.1 nickel/cobalt efflux protein RcnA [Vibrio parahaemolyticus]EHD1696352.1 nickel/cobalt efflux protein RcnA [Vibrio vulnificus]MBG0754850.1 nickel/cobalt efflux protein RcnA [Vibrio cidicii]MCR9502585.1 nickel/cobalt efflux protein RcnA [Vibrio vulnificus]